jgi:hypothetical protein
MNSTSLDYAVRSCLKTNKQKFLEICKPLKPLHPAQYVFMYLLIYAGLGGGGFLKGSQTL